MRIKEWRNRIKKIVLFLYIPSTLQILLHTTPGCRIDEAAFRALPPPPAPHNEMPMQFNTVRRYSTRKQPLVFLFPKKTPFPEMRGSLGQSANYCKGYKSYKFGSKNHLRGASTSGKKKGLLSCKQGATEAVILLFFLCEEV